MNPGREALIPVVFGWRPCSRGQAAGHVLLWLAVLLASVSSWQPAEQDLLAGEQVGEKAVCNLARGNKVIPPLDDAAVASP